MLQVALDVSEAREALRLARLVMPFVDIIEAGTPLIKACGLKIVTQLKKRFPNRQIVADMKTADVGALEARLAFRAGADITTVLGAAPLPTIEAAVAETHARSRKIVVDMIGVQHIRSRAEEIVPLAPDYLGVHIGIDEQKQGRNSLSQIGEVVEFGIPVAVAGGITAVTLESLRGFSLAVIIIGGAITAARDPKAQARMIHDRLTALWPD
jgi:3-hexulose-6-phosphate synthase